MPRKFSELIGQLSPERRKRINTRAAILRRQINKENSMTTPAPKATRVAFLLDESGSMESVKTVTLSALGEYLKTLQQGTEDIIFSLVTFSAIRTQTLAKNLPIKSIDIDSIANTYAPSGNTPLYDAAMKLIHATEKVAKADDNVVIVLQTDGQENCSKEFSLSDLQGIIKAKSDLGWKFVFLGTDIDAYGMAKRYGIGAGQTMSYDSMASGETFRSLAQNTQSYASGQSVGMDFTEQQKDAAGDKFQPGKPPGDTPVTKKKDGTLVDDIDLS